MYHGHELTMSLCPLCPLCSPCPVLDPLCTVQVLEYIPMTNYPLFINLLTTFVYIPVRWVRPRCP